MDGRNEVQSHAEQRYGRFRGFRCASHCAIRRKEPASLSRLRPVLVGREGDSDPQGTRARQNDERYCGCGTNDDETMAAAQTFADYYRATYFIGTQTFPLNDDDADEWILYDPDYENPQE